ncbi:hypothetical protein [Saccharothrix saharensis]|uniref:hypothetical protein n=1 Tax=Saccharothrix saharensis TaxID=571190 RepID=UPI0011515730|nr:hypothetical protein [Saccharothrix saharensis]
MNAHEIARQEAPRLFAIVEEYEDPKDVRVAGYGVAYDDRADANSVEVDFRLTSDSPNHARTVFEISSPISRSTTSTRDLAGRNLRARDRTTATLPGRSEGAKR